MARTDARAVEGVESAIERVNAYIETGADAIFPEALQSEQEFCQFAQRVKAPLLANMIKFGKNPFYTAEEFENMGYQMVIYPVTSLRLAAKAYERVFEKIKQQVLKRKLCQICNHEVSYMKPLPTMISKV